MKNIKLILSIIVLVLLAGGGYFAYTLVQQNQQIKEQADLAVKAQQQAMEEKQAADAALASRTKCVPGENFTIVTLDHDNAVGQDILVKQKTDGQACKYEVADGDFEIKNSDPEYYKFQAANALVTDLGTGPTGRSIRLYDLSEKKLITEKKYFGDLSLSGNTLTYFGEAKTKIKNCKGDSAVEKIVDLKTFLVKEGKTTKCVEAQ